MCESIVSVSSREVIVRDRSISATSMRVRHGMGISSVEDMIASRAAAGAGAQTLSIAASSPLYKMGGTLHAADDPT